VENEIIASPNESTLAASQTDAMRNSSSSSSSSSKWNRIEDDDEEEHEIRNSYFG